VRGFCFQSEIEGGILSMNKKGTKIHNKVRKIQDKTLDKLYFNMPEECQSCRYNSCCTEMEGNLNISEICINYKEAIGINTLIEMMKSANICIDSFCSKYVIKKEFFIEAMKGHRLLSYKEYYYLCKRLRVPEFDEFNKYEKRFLINDENKTLDCEVQI
jgi:hypothetical protein